MATTPADLTRLMAQARVRLPGAMDGVIRQELFAICDEFFNKTNAWQEEISLGVIEGETFYEIESEETTAKLIRLMSVVDANNVPIAASMQVPGELVLVLEPQLADVYTLTVALNVQDPTDDDGYPRFPAWVIELYREVLFDGLVGRMMSQPAKPYASERLAIYHLRRFRNGMAQAKVDVQHKNINGAQAWRYPRGWC